MKLIASGLSDIGRKRTHNEDNFLVNKELGLFVVADGMGGHSGGEFASRLAVSTIEEVIKGLTNDPEATVISGVNTADADHGDQLRYAIEVASSKIYDRALYDEELKGMGTTTVAVYFRDELAYIANVGDSRAYLFHANRIHQVTTDHSLVGEQLEAGVITAKDARGHKLKNIITRSVGYQEEVTIDVKKHELHMGDKILLCSDGLSNMVVDQEIENTVVGYSTEEACRRLIEKANENGGDDNVTVLIIEVIDLDQTKGKGSKK